MTDERLKWWRRLTLAAVSLAVLSPLAWLAGVGLVPRDALLRGWPQWNEIGLENYRKLFQRLEVSAYLSDSLVLALTSSLLAITLAVPASYFASRGRGRLPTLLYSTSLTVWLVPPIAFSLQIYFWFLQLGLYDRMSGMILLHAVLHSTLILLLLTPFMDSRPRRHDEVAWIEGITGFGVLWHIHVPALSRLLGGLLALAFIRSWNELLFASVLTDSNVRSLPLAMLGLTTGSRIEWGQIAALGTLSLLPIPLGVFIVWSLRAPARRIAR